ncbi:unnamed protein product [Phaedon cochleariae]|uniref:Uncharacterized protein n=1 Tax=Phaedon cochleariae TaxID=80249 RepID=A0A9N9SKQ7_PHACE|nr:unnamed protein product [Phaedon cochleariae]
MSEKWIASIFTPGARKSKLLTLDFYKKNYVTIPSLTLMFLDLCWVTFCTVEGFIRTDVVLTRKDRTQGEMTELLINPRNRKFLTINQTFPPQPELYQTYEDMKCEEEKRKEACENQ